MDLGVPPTTIGLLCVAGLSSLLFDLAFLVDWIRNWRYVKVYWAYGLGAGLGELLFAILGVVVAIFAALSAWSQFVPPGLESTAPPSGEGAALILLLAGLLVIALGLLALVISATQLAGVTMLGMHYAASLGHPSFPLLQSLRRARPPAASGTALPALAGAAAAGGGGTVGPAAGGSLEGPAPSAASVALLPAQGQSAAAESAVTTPPVAQRRARGIYALSTLGVVAAAVVYSVVLFRLTLPRIADVVTGLPGYTAERASAVTPQALLIALVTALAAAFSEELIYRLGIQGFLARYLKCQGSKYWIPVVLTSLLWTLQHAGALEPGWVKLAQIFPIGLMLGWLYRRHGVESCILAHALFNAALVPFSTFLIGT